MGVHKTFDRSEEGGSMGRGRLWRSSLRYCVVSLRFALAAIVCAWAVFLTQLDEILEMFRLGEAEAGAAVTFLENGFKGQTVLFLVPILCALPGAAVMTEEISNGFIKAYLPRSRRTDYLAGKILACSLSGGAVFLAAAALAVPGAAVIFLPFSGGGSVFSMELGGQILRLALSGAFWSAVGMLMSLLTSSLYAAYIAPFVFYYVGIIFCERYFPSLYLFYPTEWLIPGERWPHGAAGACLWVGMLTIVCWMATEAVGERKVRQL